MQGSILQQQSPDWRTDHYSIGLSFRREKISLTQINNPFSHRLLGLAYIYETKSDNMPLKSLLTGVLTLVCFLCVSEIQAQKERFALSGKLVDSTQTPLEWASVILYNQSDSAMASFAYSDKNGLFRLKNVRNGEYFMAISYLGMEPFQQSLSVSQDMDMGSIILKPQDAVLEGVDIKASRIPVLVNKDTIVYDAQAFNVGPNANVEELLKRMPGIEVEQDGSIKAQGETVQNVLVDGRRFFGNDPKMATKNLQADAVEKVQVYDRKSETAEFTGIDDGTRERTINLQLKPDRKNGVFGYASGAGGGPDGRFDGKLSLNQFNDSRQLALLAGANNINQAGFSFQDYMQFSGGAAQMSRGGGNRGSDAGVPISSGADNGFTTFGSGGVQYSKRYGNENEINTSYFYNQSRRTLDRQLDRINFLPGDQSFRYIENEDELTNNYNHRVNVNLDQKIDTFNSIKLISSLSFTQSSSNQFRESGSFDSPFGNDNSSVRDLNGNGNNYRINGSLTWRRKFEKRGRVLGLTLSGNYAENQQETQLGALNIFFTGPVIDREELLDQVQDQYGNNYSYNANLQYTEPLGNRQYLEFQYIFNQAPMRNDRTVFDVFDNEQLILVPGLSSAYEATFAYHRPGVSYRIVRDKINFNAGINWQASRLNGAVAGLPGGIDRSFEFFLPNMRFTYSVTRSKNFTADYSTNVREPSILQLQPLPNNTDPLNIYLGNPNLKPEFTNRLNLRYSTFSMATMQHFFVSGNVTHAKDRIRESQVINDQLVVERTPINISSEWDANANVNYGIPIKKLNLRLNAGVNMGYNLGYAFVNGTQNQIQRITPGGNFRVFYQWKDKLDAEAGTRANLTTNRYSVSAEQNQQLATYSHNASIRATWPKKWQFQTGLNLIQYRGSSGVFNENVPIWTASISRFILPKDRGEIKIIAQDLLNRNVGISRTVNLNFVQDEQIISLGRYFLLEFRYNINASPQTAQHGGMMRMFRMG
jgi:hypothetical protein